MNDHIIDEIRRIRDDHAQRFNYDIDAICDDYQKETIHSNRIYIKRGPNFLSTVFGTYGEIVTSVIRGEHDPASGKRVSDCGSTSPE
jgi:hypothetical protein